MIPGPDDEQARAHGTRRERELGALFRAPYRLDLVWAVLPTSLVLIGFGLLPLRSWDFWWHLYIGRLISLSGQIPSESLVLYTLPPDTPSFIQPWLSQLAFFHLHEAGGLELLLTLRNGLAAATVALVTLAARRRSAQWMHASLLTLAAALLLYPFVSLRTNLLTWPMLVPLVLLGYAINARRAPPALLVVYPPVAALWASLHGSFILPAVVCGGMGLGHALSTLRCAKAERAGRWKLVGAWAATAAAALVAPLANPQGAGVYRYMAELSSSPVLREIVTEWWPTTLNVPAGVGFYALFAFGAVALFAARRTLDPTDAVLFIGFGVLAILQVRSILWFALLFPIVVAPAIRDVLERRRAAAAEREDAGSPLNLAIALVLVGAGLLVQPWTPGQADWVIAAGAQPTRDREPLRGRVLASTPVEAARLLAATPGPHRLFHDADFSGYLLLELQRDAPYPMLFVDQRVELPPADTWERYFAISGAAGWEAAFDELAIDAAVLSHSSQRPLIEAMRADPRWELRFDDGAHALFVRRSG